MEDVLEVYRRPYDPSRPQVCIDETSKQLVEHTRIPVPPSPGRLARVDDEYRRCGTANIFLCVEPLAGETIVKATERRLVEKLEIHYTPKHGSWLDIAEIELSVLARQCLHQRIGSFAELKAVLQSWEQQRNAEERTITWRFTTDDARIRLRRLYPTFGDE